MSGRDVASTGLSNWARNLRRVDRGLTVVARWLRYVASADEGPRTAFSDLRRWTTVTLARRELAKLDLPWFTLPAVRWLEHHCRPGWRVFEWGSGASTSFFIRRGCRVVSVEHDHDWYHRIAARLSNEPNLDLRLVRPDPAPAVLEESNTEAPGTFGSYVAAVDDQPNDGLDLIVVDGRARVDCLVRARSKVMPGGAVLLDDSEREQYEAGLALFPESEWRTLHFPGPQPGSLWPAFTRTTLFLRRP